MKPEVRNWLMLWKLRGVPRPLVLLSELDKVPEEVFDHIDTYLIVQCGEEPDIRAAGIMRLPTGGSGYKIVPGGDPSPDGGRGTYTWEQVKKAIVWELLE